MIETSRKARQRRASRDSIDKYVFEPSRDYAAALALVGFGISCSIAGFFAMPKFEPLAVCMFMVSIPASFAGAGWAIMINARLDAYYYDIMQDKIVDEEITTKQDSPTATATRRIPNGNGDIAIDMLEDSAISGPDWARIATAVLISHTPIAKAPLSKNEGTKVVSQPVYDKFYAYMNAQKYMAQNNGRNELTDEGNSFLSGYLPTPPPHSQILHDGS